MRVLNRHSSIVVIVVALAVIAVPVAGKCSDGDDASDFSVPLEGRHGISLHLGFLNQVTAEREISSGGVSSETRVTGFSGALSYSYWVGPDWAVEVSGGLIDAETMISVAEDGVTSKSAGVVPLLFGATLYPGQVALGSSARPYVSLAVGPYIGFATNSNVGGIVDEETVVESVLGLRVLAGVDVFVSKRFRIGVGGGYHFVSEFDEPIGKDKDYSGAEFAFRFGVLLGKGR